ncbi:hypothetical protein KVF89_22665 [Nocardioides carbamazepini]|uniref:hypothetical protein n=1 Tax=Nocardioides carbamazepini TaxID=2854259 RepID=UPI002149B6A7|nr:hypothetical protein [Nocardioides carbamazepini]MCR1785361.1 hypothetical protein [Nocardioides carbamazepini]
MAHGITLKLRAIQPAAPTSLSTRIVGVPPFHSVLGTTLTGPSRDRSLPGKARRLARKAANAGGAR